MMRWPTDPDEKSRRLALPVSLFRRRPARTVQTQTWSLGSDAISAKPHFLREVRVFAPLSEDEHRWLNTNTTMVTYERGRLFYRPDERGEVLFILKRGRVTFFRLSGDGRKLTVTTLRAGTIFGEMALMGQAMYGCFAEAAEDCLLCVLSRSDMQTIIRRNPEVALRLLDELGTRLQEREAALESLAFRSVPSRLASLLLMRPMRSASSAVRPTRIWRTVWEPIAKRSVRRWGSSVGDDSSSPNPSGSSCWIWKVSKRSPGLSQARTSSHFVSSDVSRIVSIARR